MQILTTNPEHGFSGTVRVNHGLSESEVAAAFQAVGQVVSECLTVSPLEAAAFLDSTYGRHFADSLTHHLPAGAKLATVEQLAVAARAEFEAAEAIWKLQQSRA